MELNRDFDCTILVNSCDKYEDLWYPFFELLRVNWPDCPYDIVLNTESKTYTHPKKIENDSNDEIGVKEIRSFSLYKEGENVPWSKRLLDILSRINSEYILFMLDDFFIHSTVDQKRVEECLFWMEENKNICNFCLYPTAGPNIHSVKYAGFERRTKEAPFLVSCQVAIWRKSMLIELLRKYESPWQFEENGSQRARRKNWEFYSYQAIENTDIVNKLIIPYILSITLGYGVSGGKWLFKNKELFDKFNIAVDFSKRGMWSSREEILEFINTNKKVNEQIKQTIIDRIFRTYIHGLLPPQLISIVKNIIK